MINILTDKRPNGRKLLIVVLEPQEMDHIREGNPVVVDTGRIPELDAMVCYVPDGIKFKQKMETQMPNLTSERFAQLVQEMKVYPEIRRPLESAKGGSIRSAPDSKRH